MFNKTTTKLTVIDYFLISVTSVFVVVFLYKFLYPICGYHNLHQFFVSDSVYKNHNKLLDIVIYLIYIFSFFCFIPIYAQIKKIIKKIAIRNFDFDLPIHFNFSIHFDFDKYKIPVFIIEIITSFGYLIFYPFNGIFYKKLLCFIALLIAFSIYDSYKNLFIKDTKTFSIFAIAPIFIIIFGSTYDVGFSYVEDPHHYGESYATYFLHNKFGMQYYKDIMLVHGYVDVITSFLGNFIFNSSSMYAGILGNIFFNNICFFVYLLLLFFIFNNIYFLGLLLIGIALFSNTVNFFKMPYLLPFYCKVDVVSVILLSYLALTKKELFKNQYKWLLIYIPIAFIFPLTCTTYGTFGLVASIPLFGYVLYEFIKSKPQAYKWVSIVSLFLICVFIFKNDIANFLLVSGNYVSSNLISFGNDFQECKGIISNYYFNFFALFVIPYFILEIINEIKNKDKNIQYLFILMFCVINVLVGLAYYLGRIDGIVVRMSNESIVYLCVVIPYLVKLKNQKIYKVIKGLATLFLLFVLCCSFLKVLTLFSPLKSDSISIKYEKIYFDETVKKVVSKYSKKDNDFYALLNNGMYYYYVDKKIPIKFVSYYNIVDCNLDKEVLKQLQNADLSLVLLKTSKNDIHHDKTRVSLRTNAIYRWLLLSNKYKFLKENDCVFLVKNTNTNYKFSLEEQYFLDDILSQNDLKLLPQAWGDSIKSLPLKEIKFKFKIFKFGKIYLINFEKPIKGSDVEFVYIKTNNRFVLKNYQVLVDNREKSILNFASKSSNVLFPFDNYPSWLLDDKIEKFYIKISPNTEIKEIKFYKRN